MIFARVICAPRQERSERAEATYREPRCNSPLGAIDAEDSALVDEPRRYHLIVNISLPRLGFRCVSAPLHKPTNAAHHGNPEEGPASLNLPGLASELATRRPKHRGKVGRVSPFSKVWDFPSMVESIFRSTVTDDDFWSDVNSPKVHIV